MVQPMTLRREVAVALLATSLCCAACKDDSQGPGAASAAAAGSGQAVEHPGWLTHNDREILRLELELAAAEPEAEKRAKSVARVLGDLERGRLPESWTHAALAVGNGTVPFGVKAMWTAVVHKDDLKPILGELCRDGSLGLENMAQVAQNIEQLTRLLFRRCKIEASGFLAPDRLTNPHHAVLAFASAAYLHLSEAQQLSPEETDALRKLVEYFSQWFEEKRVGHLRPTTPTAAPSAAAPSAPSAAAPSAPSAAPSAAP